MTYRDKGSWLKEKGGANYPQTNKPPTLGTSEDKNRAPKIICNPMNHSYVYILTKEDFLWTEKKKKTQRSLQKSIKYRILKPKIKLQ